MGRSKKLWGRASAAVINRREIEARLAQATKNSGVRTEMCEICAVQCENDSGERSTVFRHIHAPNCSCETLPAKKSEQRDRKPPVVTVTSSKPTKICTRTNCSCEASIGNHPEEELKAILAQQFALKAQLEEIRSSTGVAPQKETSGGKTKGKPNMAKRSTSGYVPGKPVYYKDIPELTTMFEDPAKCAGQVTNCKVTAEQVFEIIAMPLILDNRVIFNDIF